MPPRILSLNVQGINSPHKRTKAFRQFVTLKADVICLQETHFTPSSFPKFFHQQYRQCYLASHPHKSRGVLIGFKNCANFTCYSEVPDPEGRYLIVTGLMQDTEVTIVTYYAPNSQQVTFFRSLLNLIDNHKRGLVIMCGDSNLTLLPHLDKSAFVTSQATQSREFRSLLLQYGLTDCWRELHPQEIDFSHYSAPHNYHSRIDHILVHFTSLPLVMKSILYPIPWSDHSAVIIDMLALSSQPSSRTWRLNDSSLSDPSLCVIIEDTLQTYLKLNDTSEISISTLWATHKPILRGQIIHYRHQIRKDRMQRLDQLEQQFLACSTSFQLSPTPANRKKLETARCQLNLVLDEGSDRQLKKTAHKFFTKRNKPDSMLARRLRLSDPSYTPYKLKLPSGAFTSNPSKITELFRQHLEKVYNPQPPSLARQERVSYTPPNLPGLSAQDRETLDAPITEAEVLKVITALKSHKAPGPDGLPSLYYKKFSLILAPILTRMFNSILLQGQLPPESLHASICMIPKPDSDLTHCSNYRPISLLNTDIKILAKILALRLHPLMPDLIHRDQTGFIPHRQTSDNIRRSSLLIHQARSSGTPSMLLTLDIRKAFDTVSWQHLNSTLRTLGVGPHFLKWVLALYDKPTAFISYAGFKSESFCIRSGTRQGCPLSPFLFALALEPLAQAIRNNPDITGIPIHQHQHKLSLFADDALLYITNPLVTIPNLLAELHSFANTSGLHVNTAKSMALNVNLPKDLVTHLKSQFPFPWSETKVKYLGIQLSNSYETLYSLNYPPMFKKLEAMLLGWHKLNISLTGRIAAVKMTLLPKLLYLFRTLPVTIPHAVLRSFQSKILKFIWGYRRARLSASLIQRPILLGGLSLPHIRNYYRAARVAQLTAYHLTFNRPQWVDIEQTFLKNTAISNVLWLPTPAMIQSDNPIVQSSFLIWKHVRFKYQLASVCPPLLSFMDNPDFPAGIFNPSAYTFWRLHQLTTILSLLDRGRIPTFNQLQAKVDIPQSELFRFLQISHFLSQFVGRYNPAQPITSFERFCHQSPQSPGIIKLIYQQLQSPSEESTFPYILHWNRDLHTHISSEQWRQIWSSVKFCSSNDSIFETNYKVITRWYLVPSRLHKMSPTKSALCFRRCGLPGTYMHIWWSCPRALYYWRRIFSMASILTNRAIAPDPSMALLLLNNQALRKRQFRLLSLLFAMAKLELAHSWNSPQLSVSHVKNRMNWLISMEKRTAKQTDTMDNFEITWRPWVQHFFPPGFDIQLFFI